MVARWEGGTRSRIDFGATVTYIGGDGELNPMQTLLAALVACDVDLIATHAALVEIPIESLTVEARGRFNVASYVGIEASSGSGYDRIDYEVRIRAQGVTEEQLASFRRICEVSSPVGDALSPSVPLQVEVVWSSRFGVRPHEHQSAPPSQMFRARCWGRREGQPLCCTR